MEEIWRPVPVPSYEATFEVSNLGRVRRIPTGRIVKNRPNARSRYIEVRLNAHDKERICKVHTLVAKAFLADNPYEKWANNGTALTVNHKDGDRTNNALSNLEIIPRSANIADSWKHANRPPPPPNKGSTNGMATLTEADIPFIRAWYTEGLGYHRTARRLLEERGVRISWQSVTGIVKRRTWRHVP